MSISQNLRHRRAVAAMLRRAPVPEPQLGFNPNTIPDFTDLFGLGKGEANKIKGVTITDALQGDQTSSGSATTSTISTTVVHTSTTPTSSSTSASTTTVPEAVTQQQFTTLLPKSTTTTSPSVASTSTVVVVPSTTTPAPVSTLPASAAAASVSSSPSADPSSGISTGSVVGGIIAAIVAISAIAFAAVYFVRRSRKSSDDVSFDAHDFRRSAMVINDPPTHQDTVDHGFNPAPPPPPPHMMENRMASPAPTFGAHAAPGPDYYGNEYSGNHAGYGAGQYHPYSPGQVVNTHGSPPSPITVNSAHPMVPPANYGNYGQSASSLVVSPDHYNQYGDQPTMDDNMYRQAAPAGNVATYPVLTRQSSGSGPHSPTQQQSANLQRDFMPANDYVDLDRSSVSPYQAAQYAEISRRLNTGLNATDVDRDLPPLPLVPGHKADPFADPASVPPSPGDQYANDRRSVPSTGSRPISSDSIEAHAFDFPVPPSPVHTVSSRYGIDSTPPTLPDIHVDSRVSYSGFDLPRTSTDSGLNVAPAKKFPATPSPLASSVTTAAPEPETTTFERATPAVEPPTPAVVHDLTSKEKKRGIINSIMYDAEDAYGGI